MDCPCPIKSVLPRFHPTLSSRTRPSMRIQRSEGLHGVEAGGGGGGGGTHCLWKNKQHIACILERSIFYSFTRRSLAGFILVPVNLKGATKGLKSSSGHS